MFLRESPDLESFLAFNEYVNRPFILPPSLFLAQNFRYDALNRLGQPWRAVKSGHMVERML